MTSPRFPHLFKSIVLKRLCDDKIELYSQYCTAGFWLKHIWWYENLLWPIYFDLGKQLYLIPNVYCGLAWNITLPQSRMQVYCMSVMIKLNQCQMANVKIHLTIYSSGSCLKRSMCRPIAHAGLCIKTHIYLCCSTVQKKTVNCNIWLPSFWCWLLSQIWAVENLWSYILFYKQNKWQSP